MRLSQSYFNNVLTVRMRRAEARKKNKTKEMKSSQGNFSWNSTTIPHQNASAGNNDALF